VAPRSLTPALIELARSEVGTRPVRSVLTPREWVVLDLLTTCPSTEEISGELVISLETVQSHIKHILRKLGVHSRGGAIARAREASAAALARSPRAGTSGTSTSRMRSPRTIAAFVRTS
jgi:NarL family two-component system response regulator LiaR